MMNRLAPVALSLPLMFVCSPSVAAAVPAASAPHASEALLDLETKRLDAEVAGNGTLLGTLVADDAVYVHANGEVQDKAHRLQAIAAGTSHYRSIETSARSARIYGDTAITHGHIVLNVGVDRRIAGIYTGVYAKRSGRWMLLSWQTTPIVPRQ